MNNKDTKMKNKDARERLKKLYDEKKKDKNNKNQEEIEATSMAINAMDAMKQYKGRLDNFSEQFKELGVDFEIQGDIVQSAVNTYTRIPEIITELENMKLPENGTTGYDANSTLIYEEKMEITNAVIDDVIHVIKSWLNS